MRPTSCLGATMLAIALGATAARATVTTDPASGIFLECVATGNGVGAVIAAPGPLERDIWGLLTITVNGEPVRTTPYFLPSDSSSAHFFHVVFTEPIVSACATFEDRHSPPGVPWRLIACNFRPAPPVEMPPPRVPLPTPQLGRRR